MKYCMALLALALPLLSGTAFAQSCEAEISGNDQLQFDKSEITVAADCTEVTLTLRHAGMLPVDQMGHNWVLASSADWEAIAMAGLTAGPENDYLPPDDDRIIAHTEMIGGGEETTLTFDVSSLDPSQDYTFFCSFPGHYVVMNGEFKLE